MTSFLIKAGEGIPTANRLTGLTLAVSVFLVAIASLGAWHVHNMQARSEELLSNNIISIQAAMELEMHIQELRHQLDRYLWLPEMSQPASTAFTELPSTKSRQADIDLWIRRVEATAHNPEEYATLTQIKEGLNDFYNEIKKIAAPEQLDNRRAVIAEQAETMLEEQVLAPARRYLSIDEALLEESRRSASNQSRRLVQILMCLGFFGALISLLAGYGIARTISQSLIQLRIPMQDVAGKLSEVAGDAVVSTTLDLSDLGPALERVSKQVASVVEQLHARHREILHAEQMATLGQMAAGIAHEIRNPLMSMKMLVQSALRQGAENLEFRDLQILNEEIRRLEVLMTEFLDFARPKPLSKSIVDIRDIAETTVAFMQRQADASQVNLDCHVPSEPVLLLVDAPRIQQVLLNVLLNAIQATPTGKNVRLTVEPPSSSEQVFCRVRVSDDGPGIRKDQESRLFEPFYSTKETGLGLGLPISQRIVKSHGGVITFVRADSGGAVFDIVLPMPTSEA